MHIFVGSIFVILFILTFLYYTNDKMDNDIPKWINEKEKNEYSSISTDDETSLRNAWKTSDTYNYQPQYIQKPPNDTSTVLGASNDLDFYYDEYKNSSGYSTVKKLSNEQKEFLKSLLYNPSFRNTIGLVDYIKIIEILEKGNYGYIDKEFLNKIRIKYIFFLKNKNKTV